MGTLTDAVNLLVTNTTDLQTTVTGRITDMDGKIASADTAKVAAEAAKALAEIAKSGADTAKTDAQTAQTLAESAKAAAETAQGIAATAKTDALLAKSASETAKDNAVAAQGASEAAKTNAQDWASKISGAVTGGEMSAKYHAQTASVDAATATSKASAASTSEGNALTSKNTATTKATAAGTSESNASSSASAASSSATAASGSASTATTKASDAAGSAAASASSASAASGSASTATTKASAANTSANAAASSANASASSATASSTSETNASTSEGNALTSKNTANTKANEASASAAAAGTSESNASTSEGNALTSENNASTSAGTAATKATAATGSASTASTKASEAAASATAAAGSASTAASTLSSKASTSYVDSEIAAINVNNITGNLDVTGGIKFGDDTRGASTAGAGSLRWNNGKLQNSTGVVWQDVSYEEPGTTESAAANSPSQITGASGTYWFKLGSAAAFEAYVDTSTTGGPYVLAASFTNQYGVRSREYWTSDDEVSSWQSQYTAGPFFTSTGDYNSQYTATKDNKQNARNAFWGGYSSNKWLLKENHAGSIGLKAYSLNASRSIYSHIQANQNIVSSVPYSSGAFTTLTSSTLTTFNNHSNDNCVIQVIGPSQEASGGIGCNVDRHWHSTHLWAGNICRSDGGRSYPADGTTTDHTIWLFVK